VIGLTLAALRDRALTTILNIVLLATAVAMLVLMLALSHQLGNRFERDAKGIDLVVGAKGSPLQLVLSSVYNIDQPVGNIPLASAGLLRRDPGVARVVPLALGDNFRGYRIVGTEPSYLALRDATLAGGRLWQATGEVVIGAEVARATGAGLGQRFLGSHGLDAEGGAHDAHPFTVTGVLAPTGGVADRLILTSIETVWDVHDIAHGEDAEHARHADHDLAHAGHDHDEESSTTLGMTPDVTALLVSYRNAAAALRVPATINRQGALQSAVPAIEAARLLALLGSGISGARVFGWLLAALGGLAIFAAVLNAARVRRGELALLRVLGASRAQVFGTILSEGLLVAAAAAVLGAGLAHGLLALAAGRSDTLSDIGLDPWQLSPGEPALLLSVLGIGALAALVPALAVYRTDLATTFSRAS
jgi:putative ABC transport system permease protein